MMPGPNGCTCGHNGDCNCPFVDSSARVAAAPKKPRKPPVDYRARVREYFDALRTIAKSYLTPEEIRRAVENRRSTMYGLDVEDALEMAYENIQGTAQSRIRGRKRP